MKKKKKKWKTLDVWIKVVGSLKPARTCTGSSSTPLHMGHSRSSSTSPWNLVTSYPMVHHWDPPPPHQHDRTLGFNHGSFQWDKRQRYTVEDIWHPTYLTHKSHVMMVPFSSGCVDGTSCQSEIVCLTKEAQTQPVKEWTQIAWIKSI